MHLSFFLFLRLFLRLFCFVLKHEFPHTLMIKVFACVQTSAAPVLLSVTTTWRACPTAVQKFHVATHALHIHYTWALHKHIYTKKHIFSASRGRRENRNMLDVGLKAESVRLYTARQMVAVFRNVSFANNHKPCQKFLQWQLNGPCSSFSIVNCQGLESQGEEKVFCSIKLYCNEMPDGKIRPQGCDQWWSSMNKWVLSPSGRERDLRGFRRAMCLLTSGSLVQLWLAG